MFLAQGSFFDNDVNPFTVAFILCFLLVPTLMAVLLAIRFISFKPLHLNDYLEEFRTIFFGAVFIVVFSVLLAYAWYIAKK